MEKTTVKCPKCGEEIPLTEALTGQIESEAKAKYEQLAGIQKKQLADALDAIENDRKRMAAQVASAVQDQLKVARNEIIASERTRLASEQATTLAALEGDLKAKDASLAAMRQAELDLRQKAREAEERASAAALETQRKMDAERAAIKVEAVRVADESAALKLREKDNLLSQMQEQIEALKRKAETGSQEAQGEALEDMLQEFLERTFPFDKFEEVKKGVRGGDIIQIVRNNSGKICGRILWESKNTKAFSRQWIEKVKSDQMLSNANISIIATTTLPDDFIDRGQRFGLFEGVWITDSKSAGGVATAIRYGIIEADKQKVVSANQDSLKDLLYEYLTSKEAILKITAVMDAVKRMEDELTAERRAMERIWAGRGKQIMAISANFSGFFGGIEGLMNTNTLTCGDAVKQLEAITE